MRACIGDTELDFPSVTFGELRDCNGLLGDAAALRRRMDEDGYLLVRGLIPHEAVLAARLAVFGYMRDQGDRPFADGTALEDAVFNPQGKGARTMGERRITHDPAVLRVLEAPELFAFFERFFGEPARTFDYKWLRAVPPGQGTGAHFDNVYMGRGSSRLHTTWIPFGDIGPELGSLAVCLGAHKLPGFEKLRSTYGRMDVDRDKVQGWFSSDPNEVTNRFGGTWATARFSAGDVMIFGMLTLHAGTKNLTQRYRLSCDVRFQPAADVADERWVGENPKGHYAWEKGTQVSMADARAKWGV